MGNMLNNEILTKLDEIVDYIKDSDTYKRFVIVKKQIDNNIELKNKFDYIKFIQREMIKTNNKDLELEYNTLVNELNNYPQYSEYLELLDELNNLYQEIKIIIENHINEILN